MTTARVIKNETVAFLGELTGTFLFLFFGFAGAQTVNHAVSQSPIPANQDVPNLGKLLFISTIFGMSLAINVWIFFRVSGGMFNPVVTMSLYLAGAFPILRAVVVVVAQMAGGIAAAVVVKYLIPSGMEVKHTLSLSTNTSPTRGLLLEMFFTAELVFTILMLAAEKSKTTFLAPLGIGFALFISHLGGVFFTGAGLNPARAFASAFVAGEFPSYHWIYWAGPAMGGLLAVLVHKGFKIFQHEDANGDQDKSAYEPESLIALLEKRAEVSRSMFAETPRAVENSPDWNDLKRRKRSSITLAGDSSFELQQIPSGSRVSPRTERHDSLRYHPTNHEPLRPQPAYRPTTPPERTSIYSVNESPYSYSPSEPLTKKQPVIVRQTEVHGIDSAPSSVLHLGASSPPPPMPRPPVAPFPSRKYEAAMQNSIPIGMTRAVGGRV